MKSFFAGLLRYQGKWSMSRPPVPNCHSVRLQPGAYLSVGQIHNHFQKRNLCGLISAPDRDMIHSRNSSSEILARSHFNSLRPPRFNILEMISSRSLSHARCLKSYSRNRFYNSIGKCTALSSVINLSPLKRVTGKKSP